jgi:transcription antitermination factor NusG
MRFDQIAQWFALSTKPCHESAAATLLRQKSVDSLLPLYTAVRQWSDRKKKIRLPVFPGYVFSRFDFKRRAAILSTPGIRSIVAFGGIPAPVSEYEIASLKIMIESKLPLEPWPFLKTGDRVRVAFGPLKGCGGILIRGAKWRVVVGIELLQRSVSVEIPRDSIRPES